MEIRGHRWYFLFVTWIISLIATTGSLFFSEVMEYPPCQLCWYQRIAMYPLVVILLIGLFSSGMEAIKFAFPLAGIGWVITVYHNLLYYDLIPESIETCNQGVSCTTVYISWWGFITIPLLSGTAFTLILIWLTILKLAKK